MRVAPGSALPRSRPKWLKIGCLLLTPCVVWLLLRFLVFHIAKQADLATARAETYASDTPELNGDNDPRWVAHLHERVGRYLSSTGVSPSHVEDLLFAYRPYDLLARFRLSDSDLRRFLRDKKRIAESATDALGTRDQFGYGVDLGPEGVECFGPSEDNEKFFDRLAWWPIPPNDRSSYAVYRATLRWDTVQWHVGATYYVLVNHHTNEVYLLAG